MRYALFGAPVLFPTGVAMAFERMTYGLVYGLSRWQGVIALYRCLVAAMLAGRIVWGIAQMAFLGITSEGFTWRMFLMLSLIHICFILGQTILPDNHSDCGGTTVYFF